MKIRLLSLAVMSSLMAVGGAQAAQPLLYPTGPAQDSSFVRFVDGAQAPISVVAAGSQAKLDLDASHPASDFLPIAAGKPIEGTLQKGSVSQKVSVTVKPGEFVTVVGLDDAKGGLQVQLVREQPDDFNALKASIAFANLDGQCASPALLAAGRNVVILDSVPVDQVKRRQVNPVNLSVQLSCGGKAQGSALSLGTLQAGQRYTVFLVPAGSVSKIFYAADSVAH